MSQGTGGLAVHVRNLVCSDNGSLMASVQVETECLPKDSKSQYLVSAS